MGSVWHGRWCLRPLSRLVAGWRPSLFAPLHCLHGPDTLACLCGPEICLPHPHQCGIACEPRGLLSDSVHSFVCVCLQFDGDNKCFFSAVHCSLVIMCCESYLSTDKQQRTGNARATLSSVWNRREQSSSKCMSICWMNLRKKKMSCFLHSWSLTRGPSHKSRSSFDKCSLKDAIRLAQLFSAGPPQRAKRPIWVTLLSLFSSSFEQKQKWWEKWISKILSMGITRSICFHVCLLICCLDPCVFTRFVVNLVGTTLTHALLANPH